MTMDASEVIARAIYEDMPYDGPAGTTKPTWVDGGNSFKQDEARRTARRSESALREAGYAVVPVVATDVMCEAGDDGHYGMSPQDVWGAMIAAHTEGK